MTAFGGLSIADIQTLFGTNSTSASSSASSKGTTQSASIEITTASANDPAKAIKEILAQATINQASPASSGGASALSLAAEAAYSAEMSNSSSIADGSETSSSSSEAQQPGVPSQASSSTTGSTSAAEMPDQVASANSSLGTMLTSLDASAEAFNAGIGSYGTAGLAVFSSYGEVSITTGEGNGDPYQSLQSAVAYRSNSLLESYQAQTWGSQQETTFSQEEQAADAAQTASASTASASDADGTTDPQSQQSYLRLSVVMTNALSSNPNVLNSIVAAQAEQLVSAFQNQTLGGDSADASGFTYSENLGAASAVDITGLVVSGSDNLFNNGQFELTGQYNLSAYQDLASESTQCVGGVADFEQVDFLIPIVNS
ncbi:MAG TPA: hypothetical protein VG271_14240 [Beijerinckiaceae bacterium]|nr:hypothetical protein [Beijerinckiaceae bacterium]